MGGDVKRGADLDPTIMADYLERISHASDHPPSLRSGKQRPMKEQPDSAASERKTVRPNLKRGGMAAGAIALAIGAGALWNGGSSPSPKADLVRTSQQAVTAAEGISTSVRSFINALPTAEQDAFWQRRDLGNDPGLNGSRVNDTAHSSLELGYVRAGDLGERAVAINRALTAAERDLKTYTKGAYKATDGNGILPENPQSATLEDYRKFLHNSAERVSTLHSAVNRVAPSVEHNKDAKAALDGMQRWAIHFPGKEEIDAGVVGENRSTNNALAPSLSPKSLAAATTATARKSHAAAPRANAAHRMPRANTSGRAAL
ncbi:hypothetical protein LG943_06460 [Streptomonospora sp. S1-112]|uniref:Uncharacterized protein n=1 Tax=Streptomonospora mangrovi TaxID=2883123 RepID=A0A9X3SGB8_9ACTN|nr:hypothetical protein [Streptomonospora mangrovi]MDA0563969.1 hypothetical protein [Streptomonospora mangrovi]